MFVSNNSDFSMVFLSNLLGYVGYASRKIVGAPPLSGLQLWLILSFLLFANSGFYGFPQVLYIPPKWMCFITNETNSGIESPVCVIFEYFVKWYSLNISQLQCFTPTCSHLSCPNPWPNSAGLLDSSPIPWSHPLLPGAPGSPGCCSASACRSRPSEPAFPGNICDWFLQLKPKVECDVSIEPWWFCRVLAWNSRSPFCGVSRGSKPGPWLETWLSCRRQLGKSDAKIYKLRATWQTAPGIVIECPPLPSPIVPSASPNVVSCSTRPLQAWASGFAHLETKPTGGYQIAVAGTVSAPGSDVVGDVENTWMIFSDAVGFSKWKVQVSFSDQFSINCPSKMIKKRLLFWPFSWKGRHPICTGTGMSHQEAQKLHPSPDQQRLVEVATRELSKLQGCSVTGLTDAHDVQLAISYSNTPQNHGDLHFMAWHKTSPRFHTTYSTYF